MFEIQHSQSEADSSTYSGATMTDFSPVAYMRHAIGLSLPAGCKEGELNKAGLLFVNKTGQTQELIVGTEVVGVPRFKSRIVEIVPRQTDIWLKGGSRYNYSLQAGVIYRFNLEVYERGIKKNVETPPERLVEISVRNSGTSGRELFLNGEVSVPVSIPPGKQVKLQVPTGEILLSYYTEDKPDAYYLVIRPQTGCLVDML